MVPNSLQKRPKAYSYIRMSTDAQLKGDSLRRQLENSERYIAENNLEAADVLSDIGVSAFRGANMEYGALGRFVQAVQNGYIEPGSYLIVEAFDRISRQPTPVALQLFLQLINNGITVVTLANQQKYTSAGIDTTQLIISIIEMSTAAKESENKSFRLKRMWQNKRELAHSGKLTSRGPAWLQYSYESKQFEPIPERVEVIQRIFNEAILGIGAFTIAKRLNDDGVPTFGLSSRWQPSSVNMIIATPAVIGEFQLHKEEDGVRMTVGEPIRGYFPAVVSEETYHSAQAARLARKTNGGGRRGKYFSNIFSKLIYCYYCGARMLFEDKGGGPKGRDYFVCMSIPTGADCVRKRWKYPDFEASFLAFVQQIDLGSIFSVEKDAAHRASIAADITSRRGQLLQLKRKRDKTFELSLEKNMDTIFIAEKLREFEALIAKEEKAIAAERDKLRALAHTAAGFYESRDQIKDLIDQVKVKSEDNYTVRAEIASRLKSLIDRIEVASIGQSRSNQRVARVLEKIQNDVVNEDELREKAGDVGRQHRDLIDKNENLRFFVVKFKDGTRQYVWPSKDDPLKFEQRVAPVYEIGGERIQIV